MQVSFDLKIKNNWWLAGQNSNRLAKTTTAKLALGQLILDLSVLKIIVSLWKSVWLHLFTHYLSLIAAFQRKFV